MLDKRKEHYRVFLFFFFFSNMVVKCLNVRDSAIKELLFLFNQDLYHSLLK